MDSLHQVGIKAAPEVIYQAITAQAGLQGWWSEHSKAEGTVGSVNEVSFYGGMVVFRLRNAELDEDKKVVWSVEGGPPPWLNTKISFTLSPGEGPNVGQTMIDFAHRGLELPEAAFAGINYTWGWYLSSLKFFAEKGEGMPHTDADMAG